MFLSKHSSLEAVGAPDELENEADSGSSAYVSRWFENLSTACFFLNSETLEIHAPNRAATTMLAMPGDLSTVGGRLSFGGKAATDRFRHFARGLGVEPAAYAVGGGEADRPLLLRLERMSSGDLIAVQVFTTRLEDGPWADISAIFGLTRAEVRMVKNLIGGANIEELSGQLGISVETARTHVRRSYIKIGVSNREQLFATLAPFRLRA